jgi:hypothetical protein
MEPSGSADVPLSPFIGLAFLWVEDGAEPVPVPIPPPTDVVPSGLAVALLVPPFEPPPDPPPPADPPPDCAIAAEDMIVRAQKAVTVVIRFISFLRK